VTPKKWRIIYFVGIAVSILILFIGYISEGIVAFCSVTGLVIFCTTTLTTLSGIIFWRCPSCRKILPIAGMVGMEYCAYCSSSLEKK
jgi:hypothetical protein